MEVGIQLTIGLMISDCDFKLVEAYKALDIDKQNQLQLIKHR